MKEKDKFIEKLGEAIENDTTPIEIKEILIEARKKLQRELSVAEYFEIITKLIGSIGILAKIFSGVG